MLTPEQRAELRRIEKVAQVQNTRSLVRAGWRFADAYAMAGSSLYQPFPFKTIEDGT